MKDFAFARAGAERVPNGRRRGVDLGQRPLARPGSSFSGGTDEIGDIPSFLRRERVDS